MSGNSAAQIQTIKLAMDSETKASADVSEQESIICLIRLQRTIRSTHRGDKLQYKDLSRADMIIYFLLAFF